MGIAISPGKRCDHHLWVSTLTVSHGGLPTSTSNPPLSRRNTSGKSTGMCAGFSGSSASCASSFAAAFAMRSGSTSATSPPRPMRLSTAASNSSFAVSASLRAFFTAFAASCVSARFSSGMSATSTSTVRAAYRASSMGASNSVNAPLRPGTSTSRASSMDPIPVRLLAHTRLWSRLDIGNPRTNVWIQMETRASSTAMGLMSRP
uniref:Unannotated protein n=1 Tax=freshwater metagenome TaxID=449393 RepID=A0A6J7NB05_9ZZZZ